MNSIQILDSSVPKIRTKTPTFPAWFTQEIKSNIKRKETSRRTWKLAKSDYSHCEYKFKTNNKETEKSDTQCYEAGQYYLQQSTKDS